MMDQVDLDASQARADLLPDKYDRRRISQTLAIRRLSSRHYKRPMSEGNVCSGWMLLLVLVRFIHSKYWRSFKSRHSLLVCFVSLPAVLCWKISKKLFKLLAALCDAVVVFQLYREVIYFLWLSLMRHWLKIEVPAGELQVVGSKVTEEPVPGHISYELYLYYGLECMWFGSLLLGLSRTVIRQRLIMSGDVELNPGPNHQEIEKVLESVDETMFEKEHWNILIIECKSLSGQWEKVSGYLGLSFELIESIKRDNPKDSSGCWNEALKQWIKQNYNTAIFGRPSWRSLLKAVAEVDKLLFQALAVNHSVVTDKCELVQPKERVEGSSSQAEGVSTHVQGEHAFPGKSTASAGIAKPQGRFTFHCLNVKDMSKEKKEELHQKLYAESEDMMYKFQELFTSTTDSLRNRNVPVKELVRHLECLGQLKPTFDDSSEPVFRRQLPEIRKSESIDNVMSVVNNYCSFFNYRMLEHIINKLGTEQDKLKLAKYKEDFAKYGERHVFECPSEVGEMSEENQANMFVTLDESFDNCNVSHLSAFVSNLQKVLNISDITLRLCRIGPGSLKLIFQIPHFVQQAIFPLSSDQEADLVCLGVVHLSCGDYQFTVEDMMEVEEPTDGDSDHSDSDAELSSMAAGLAVGKPGDTLSIADSALGRSSVITGTTAGVTQFSEDLFDRELRDLADMGMGHGVAGGSSKNELHLASEWGDLQEVKRLTEEKQLNPLQKEGEYGVNALHYAARYGQLGVLKYFIEERRCNPASQDNRAMTPLHYAAMYKHLDIVRYVVAEQQMDPLCCADTGTTPLHLACQAGDINIVRYLVNELSKFLPLKDITTSRGKNGLAPIDFAALNGHLETVQYFVTELNCDPNIATPVEYQGRTTRTGGRIALHCAAQRGHLQVIKYLVEQCNCNPLQLDSERVTPLHMAATHGHLDVIKYLTLEQHCDPLCVAKSNSNTPVHDAALNGHLKTVQFFIETLQCPPDIRGQRNGTPLDMACSKGHYHVVKYLESIHPKLK